MVRTVVSVGTMWSLGTKDGRADGELSVKKCFTSVTSKDWQVWGLVSGSVTLKTVKMAPVASVLGT